MRTSRVWVNCQPLTALLAPVGYSKSAGHPSKYHYRLAVLYDPVTLVQIHEVMNHIKRCGRVDLLKR